MPISEHIQTYLADQDIPFELIHHYRSEGTAQTAVMANIPLSSMAKAVVMEDHDNHHLMAVVPADHKVKIHELEKLTHSKLKLVPENKLSLLFDDCDVGAIPALGPAYHMDTYYDTSLLEHEELHLESGDHQCLILLPITDFKKIMGESHGGDISELAGDAAAISY